MAACDVDCTLAPEVVNSSCTSGDVTIPELPTNLPDINIPSAQTVTEELVTGDGVFDIYMRAGMNQLMTQYEDGRIKGPDFAVAYTALIQVMMVEANKFTLGLVQAEIAAAMFPLQYLKAGYEAALIESQANKAAEEVKLLCQQIAELKENGAVERLLKEKQAQVQVKQAQLYARQIIGFDEKASTDASKIIMDSWAVSAVEEPDVATYGTGFEKGGVAAGTTGNLTKLSNKV